MTNPPSIKGSAFTGVVETVKDLIDKMGVSDEELSRHFSAEDLETVSGFISPSRWYDLGLHDRLLQFIREKLGLRTIQETARASARALIDSGLYQQTVYLKENEVTAVSPQERSEVLGRNLKITSTMSQMLFNCSRWEPKPDPEHPDRHILEITEGGAFRDLNLIGIVAFVNEMAGSRGSQDDLWQWRRVSPDVVELYMTRAA